jgi:hypothetical protein
MGKPSLLSFALPLPFLANESLRNALKPVLLSNSALAAGLWDTRLHVAVSLKTRLSAPAVAAPTLSNNMPIFAPTFFHTKNRRLATASLPASTALGPRGSQGKAPHRSDTPPSTSPALSVPPIASRPPQTGRRPHPLPFLPLLALYQKLRQSPLFPDHAPSQSFTTSTR